MNGVLEIARRPSLTEQVLRPGCYGLSKLSRLKRQTYREVRKAELTEIYAA